MCLKQQLHLSASGLAAWHMLKLNGKVRRKCGGESVGETGVKELSRGHDGAVTGPGGGAGGVWK